MCSQNGIHCWAGSSRCMANQLCHFLQSMKSRMCNWSSFFYFFQVSVQTSTITDKSPTAKVHTNPLSAIWRIYPSSEWSSQWPYDGYIRHGWMTSCGCGRDSATSECFGRGSRGTIFVRSLILSLFFLELCPFRRVFLFSALLKDLAPNVQALGLLVSTMTWRSFENSALSPGIFFLRTPTTTTSIFWKCRFLFQSRAGVTRLPAMAIPRLSKALWWWYVEN